MSHFDILRRLLPPVAYDLAGEGVSVELAAAASVLDASAMDIARILDEADILTTVELIDDFERVYGLPDVCRPAVPESLDERRALVRQKMLMRGGQSIDYYTRLLASLGLIVKITEFRPHTVDDDVDHPIYGQGWAFTWDIHALIEQVDQSTVTSPVDEPLGRYQQINIECLMRRLKPAHTVVLFSYPE